MPVDLPLSLEADGSGYSVRALLANRDGVMVDSPRLFSRGTRLEAHDPASGRTLSVEVVWTWVEGSGEDRCIRLALERVGPGDAPWSDAYDQALKRLGMSEHERRRHPRLEIVLDVEVHMAGSSQLAETFDVSERGAGMVTMGPLEPGVLMRLVRPDRALHTQARVVWVWPAHSDDKELVRTGVELVSPPPDFWNGRGAGA